MPAATEEALNQSKRLRRRGEWEEAGNLKRQKGLRQKRSSITEQLHAATERLSQITKNACGNGGGFNKEKVVATTDCVFDRKEPATPGDFEAKI